jgi:peptidase E
MVSTLCFIGGEDVRGTDSVHMVLLRERPGARVLVFPWSAPPSETSNLWMDIYRSCFLDAGAAEVGFADLGSPTGLISEQIAASDLLYLPGGDPRILAENIRARELGPVLGAFEGVVAGNSAGAMAMARRAVTLRGQDGEPQTSVCEGLGLADITVSVHYGAPDPEAAGASPDQDLAALSASMGIEILAIPEASAVVVRGGSLSCRGEVFVFRGGRRHRLGPA